MKAPTKAELRSQALQRRAALPERVRLELSHRIHQHLLAHPWLQVSNVVHTYCSFGTEVDTHALYRRLLEMGKRVAVPIVVEGEADLYHVWLRPETVFRPNRWGIPEPEVPPAVWLTAAELRLQRTDLVLVPLVAYDQFLYRLGYGRGYYDRFLRSVPAQRVGLAFSVQAIESFPHEPQDIALDAVITEEGVLYSPGASFQ
ncbi:MAG: 5-formyltetrahydrofolate cyclo-ligase [Candidatus Kapabacteria bacterium]|nr:5-formyltetrahydrofolate cyclo-ligase [Candidatus Kapabacteria bacterium]MDW8224680.1 5-formyltetrahydrofolate cyclo-ligase [Bacteroidota bacterium]